jgi:L-iditol 2-dehydrogenase
MELKNVSVPDSSKTAVLTNKLKVEIENQIPREIGEEEVLVKVMAVGICGSDIHFYENGRIGRKEVTYPFVLGHESAGIVVEVGEKVTNFKKGDRVAVEPGVSCMKCEYCKKGRYNICPNVQFLSSPPTNGTFTQYLVHPEHFLHRIPDHVTFEEAALVEPLSVGIQACKNSELKRGDDVLITGLGPIGLMTVIAAKEFGAKKIIVSDIEPLRLVLSKKLGATHFINPKEEKLTSRIAEITDGIGVDISIDTSGQPFVINEVIHTIKRGGKLVPIGFPVTENVPLDITQMIMKEIFLITVYRFANTYPLGIEIMASKKYNCNLLITDHFSLDEADLALEKARTTKQTSIKVMVYPNELPAMVKA